MIFMYNPYAVGRWHRFFIESNGTNNVLTGSDMKDVTLELGGNVLTLPAGYRIIDTKFDINSIENQASMTQLMGTSILADGRQCVMLPQANIFDHMFLYVFARRS